MGCIWLLVLVAQSVSPEPAPRVDVTPRFAIGFDAGGGVAGPGEVGGVVLGAGARLTIPLGGRYAFDARATQGLPNVGGGIYELRIRRGVNWRGGMKPDYAGVGAIGYYALASGLYGKIEPRLDHVSRPIMASFVAGWENRSGARLAAPFELSVMVHPAGLFAASATIGLTWSPKARVNR